MGGSESKSSAYQSYKVPGTGAPGSGESATHRHPVAKAELKSTINEVKTLYENFNRGVSNNPGRPALGKRKVNSDGSAGEFEWLSYAQVAKKIEAIASGLVQLGSQKGDNVGLYSQNRLEWVLIEQSCNRQSFVTTPLYDTFGPDAVEFIVDQANLEVICCAAPQAKVLLGCLDKLPALKHIVQFEDVDRQSVSLAARHGVTLLSLTDVEAKGSSSIVPANPPKPSDLATLCYTSGTTGVPKGAMLTHGNMIAALAGIGPMLELRQDDVHLSYLPLPHMFERMVQVSIFHYGACVGFFRGDVTLLMEDVQALQPTIFPSVPRLFNRVFDKIMQGVEAAGGVKKALFDYAYSAKEYHLKSGGYVTHALWDRLVFAKIRQALGGRVRLMVTGAAPISAQVKDFLQIAFCCPVIEGYGLTETCAGGTLTPVGMGGVGHVGIPAACVEIKLVDVVDMKYTAMDKPNPRGEICIRGANIFQGYYKNEEVTKECLEPNGWFHTGDIGKWNDDGTLSIIDRKKNIFKLAQGEYVAPEKIENVYTRSQYIAQAFVHGDSLRRSLVGVIIPDPEVAEAWAKEQGITQFNLSVICQDPKFQKKVQDSLQEFAKDAKLQGFEQVRAFRLVPEPFAVDNGLMTPTFKLKRPQLREHFRSLIESMYQEIGE